MKEYGQFLDKLVSVYLLLSGRINKIHFFSKEKLYRFFDQINFKLIL